MHYLNNSYAVENSYSVENNTSNVTVYCVVDWDFGSYARDNPHYYFVINGKEVTGDPRPTKNFNVNVRDSGSETVASFTTNVPHNADGTGSMTWACYYQGRNGPNGAYISASGNLPLTTIPRASEIVSIGSFDIEKAFALEIDKKAQSFTDRLTIKLGDEVIKVVNNYESEANIQFTDEEQLRLYNLIADWDATLTFLLETYNGSTLVGSDTATETVHIGGDVTYHTGGTDRKATFYIGTANGIKRCITYDGVKRTYR